MIRTIEFPATDAFQSGLFDTTERTAYLDGLSTLEDKLRSDTKNLSRQPLRRSMRFDTKAMPHLLNHLDQCIERVDAVEAELEATHMISTAVETIYLQVSMRNRLIDLFRFATEQKWGSVKLSDYSPDEMSKDALIRDVRIMSTAGFPSGAMERTLGIDVTGLQESLEPLERFDTSPGIPYPRVEAPVYTHTNSRGITYYLNVTTVTLRGGKPQRIYFFSKTPNPGKGTATDLPSDRVVKENPRNGFLTISKKK